MMDAPVQAMARPGVDDLTLFAGMADHLPALMANGRLDAKPNGRDELCCRFPRFHRFGNILETLATGIATGEIQVPE